MSFAEVFTALQTGAVDGQENPLSLIWSSRFHDVQKYVTLWDYSYDALAFVSSSRFWSTLDEDDQKMFARAAQEAMDFQREVVKQEDIDLVGKLEEAGMTVTKLSDEQLDAFKKALEPVYKEYKEKLGTEFVETLENGGAGKGRVTQATKVGCPLRPHRISISIKSFVSPSRTG